mmetsp:Transcript_138152/g.257782  ORF Transcript_138152/g.257782 Transcript_138152/m.257782 type:complete len:223 (-) Transcript_138152:664-1332(-)
MTCFGSRNVATTTNNAAGTVNHRAEPTPKDSPFSGVLKQLIMPAVNMGTTAKLMTWMTKVEDAVEKERRYDGMDVIKIPAEIGKKAPAPKSQTKMNINRGPKVPTHEISTETQQSAKKPQATRSATVWWPALKPAKRSQRRAPTYVPTTGARPSTITMTINVGNGGGAPGLSAKYGVAHNANPATVAWRKKSDTVSATFKGLRLRPCTISRSSRMRPCTCPT